MTAHGRGRFSLDARAGNLGVAVFLTLFANHTFFRLVTDTYPPSTANVAFWLSLAVLVTSITLLLLTLFTLLLPRRAVWVVTLLGAAVCAYAMDTYGVVIDTEMLHNALETNVREALDLATPTFFGYLLAFGLPALALGTCSVRCVSAAARFGHAATLIAVLVVVMGICIAPLSRTYASFLREHKPLRYNVNPVAPFYALVTLATENTTPSAEAVVAIGLDAHIPATDASRELVILVVGETARADRFSVNGYTAHDTSPGLSRESLISFSDVTSCGTSTSVSLPCMFSITSRQHYDRDTAAHTENVLDLLTHAGVNVLWRDNNAGAKGVADRIEQQRFDDPAVNPDCDTECRDVGMLANLDAYISAHPTGDIVIVLHQMGSHGPAYWKRSPPDAQRFEPVCQSIDLDQCTDEEINNAYDNTILYTDQFLTRVIDFLKDRDGNFETAMLYVSDHGESLGESGVYLHGLPFFMAPAAQTHVPMFLWFGSHYRIDRAALQRRAGLAYSHDNLPHTLLGLLDIESALYDPVLDIVHGV